MALSCSRNLSKFLLGKASKQDGSFYYWNCFNSFKTNNNLEFYERECEKKGLCGALMPSEGTKMLEFN